LAAFGTSRALGFAVSPRTVAAGPATKSRVGLVRGDDRARNVFEALKAIESDVRKAIEGKKRVLIKPNFVSTTNPLAATQARAVEGILEFLKPFFSGEIVIGESAAGAPTEEGFKNFGYLDLAKKCRVRLVNFDRVPHRYLYVIDPRFRPRRVRVTRKVFDPDTFIISAAVLKTHDRVVATLSLKNLLVGAVIKDLGFHWGGNGRLVNDKPLTHGGGTRGINFNLFKMAEVLRPDLSVIDGFRGMEGNGPIGGTPVDHRIAIASADWLAADRVAVEVMGLDYSKIGYLNFCGRARLGRHDLAQIEVLGEKIENVKRTYRPHDNVEKQYDWG